MRIGDLVRYYTADSEPDDELGIVVEYSEHPGEARVVWYTCNNIGWWDLENLEVLSENR